jgi:hypothetical protein
LWDTWSESYSNSDPIPETQINAFFETDNTVIVNCGTKGSLYQYSGGILVPIKRIPGTWTVGNSMIVHQNAVANIAGKPLFGFSNVSNNPNLSGVYSIGGFSSEYPQVLSLDYIISQNKLASIDVTAMVSVGDDLYVAWQDGTTFGIDKIDTLNKYANAYLESKVFMFDRTLRTNIKRININYRTMPTGSNIYLYTSNNLGTYSSVTLTNDSARKQMFSSNIIPNIFSLQLKIELAPNGNDAPEIESITFEY